MLINIIQINYEETSYPSISTIESPVVKALDSHPSVSGLFPDAIAYF